MKTNTKIYVINHLPSLKQELINEYKKYEDYCQFVSYPQTDLPDLNNTIYNINECDNIFEYDHSVGELAKFHYVIKNEDYIKYDYIGFGHYRRMWFKDTLDKIDDIFEDYDLILPKPIVHNETNYQRVKYGCGNIDEFIEICKGKFPEYSETIDKVANDNKLYPHNIFIIKSDKFEKYYEFIYTILFTYINKYGFENDNDIRNYVIEHPEWFYYNEEQGASIYSACRYIATVSEFLSTVYFVHNFEDTSFISPYIFFEGIYPNYNND